MNQIIKSILDTDLYKLSMMAAVSQLFPKAKVKYTFINRGNHEFPEGFAEELRREIRAMENLQLQDYEREFLEKKCKVNRLIGVLITLCALSKTKGMIIKMKNIPGSTARALY